MMSSYRITQQFFATVKGKRREVLRTVKCDVWPCCGPFVGTPTPPIIITHIVNGTNDIYNGANLVIN